MLRPFSGQSAIRHHILSVNTIVGLFDVPFSSINQLKFHPRFCGGLVPRLLYQKPLCSAGTICKISGP